MLHSHAERNHQKQTHGIAIFLFITSRAASSTSSLEPAKHFSLRYFRHRRSWHAFFPPQFYLFSLPFQVSRCYLHNFTNINSSLYEFFACIFFALLDILSKPNVFDLVHEIMRGKKNNCVGGWYKVIINLGSSVTRGLLCEMHMYMGLHSLPLACINPMSNSINLDSWSDSHPRWKRTRSKRGSGSRSRILRLFLTLVPPPQRYRILNSPMRCILVLWLAGSQVTTLEQPHPK